MSNKNLPFLFVSSKDQTSCSSFLQTRTWNLSIYSGYFSKTFPTFQSTEAAFESYSTKVVVQQNDVIKYSSSAPVVKSRKALHANLFKTVFHHRYFLRNLTLWSNNDIDKYNSLATSDDNFFWEHSWMAVSQGQLWIYVYFKSSSGYTYFTFLTVMSC